MSTDAGLRCQARCAAGAPSKYASGFLSGQPAWFTPGESTSNPPLGFLRDSKLVRARPPLHTRPCLGFRISGEADTPNRYLLCFVYARRMGRNRVRVLEDASDAIPCDPLDSYLGHSLPLAALCHDFTFITRLKMHQSKQARLVHRKTFLGPPLLPSIEIPRRIVCFTELWCSLDISAARKLKNPMWAAGFTLADFPITNSGSMSALAISHQSRIIQRNGACGYLYARLKSLMPWYFTYGIRV